MVKIISASQEFNCEFDLGRPREVSFGFATRIRLTLYFPDSDCESFVLRTTLIGHSKTKTGVIDKRSRQASLVSRRDEDLTLVIEAIDDCVSGFDKTADSFRTVKEIAKAELAEYLKQTGEDESVSSQPMTWTENMTDVLKQTGQGS